MKNKVKILASVARTLNLRTEEEVIQTDKKDKVDTLYRDVVDFFKNTDGKITDKQVHDFAKSIGVKEDVFEEKVYQIISDLLRAGTVGKHRHMDDSLFDAKQLKMGIKVEMEHTDNPNIAREIARDHLVSTPDYYTRLLKYVEPDELDEIKEREQEERNKLGF